MIPLPHTAMVLAAGHGTRMRPLTESTPKPLIEVGGKALIDWMLDPLAEAGVKRCIVNVCWLADQVEAHVSKRSDMEVIISDERSGALETGGGLAKARPLLGDDPVFVINTDAFWAPPSPVPFTQLADHFNTRTMDALLLLADTERCLGFPGAGDFFIEPNRQLARRGDADRAPWAYAGVRIIKPQLYDNEPAEPFSALRIWDALIAKDRLSGQPLDSFWLHVGDPDALEDANAWLMAHGLAPLNIPKAT